MTDLGTYDRQVAIDLHQQRLQGTLAGWLSLFGLGLACLGIYSVMSCSVSTRRRELGSRRYPRLRDPLDWFLDTRRERRALAQTPTL